MCFILLIKKIIFYLLIKKYKSLFSVSIELWKHEGTFGWLVRLWKDMFHQRLFRAFPNFHDCLPTLWKVFYFVLEINAQNTNFLRFYRSD